MGNGGGVLSVNAQIRDPLAGEPHPAREDRPSPNAPDWAAAKRSAAFLCKFHLSGGKLDKAAPRHRQGRMASGRVEGTEFSEATSSQHHRIIRFLAEAMVGLFGQ
jgi:hypothetical protein